jgi:hypothetical protein
MRCNAKARVSSGEVKYYFKTILPPPPPGGSGNWLAVANAARENANVNIIAIFLIMQNLQKVDRAENSLLGRA